MIHYDYYADVPDDAIDELVRAAQLGRLVTASGSTPHIGLYPFTRADAGFEMHLHRNDEQVADLRENTTCIFEIDEPLSVIPSHWIDPENAVFATAYHRTVAFECGATLVDDADAIARQQASIMARYQPEGGYRPVDARDALYTGMLRQLVGVRLTVRKSKVKFKLGQNRDFATRANIIARLRERGTEVDRKTADALQWTIDLGWTTKGRSR